MFILAVSAVLKGPLTVGNVLGYSLGFGAGVMLGIYFEERLAIGHSMFRIYSPAYGHEIAEALRAAGHAATEFPAIGRDGTLVVVNCAVSRRNASAGARGDRGGRSRGIRHGGRSASDAARVLQALVARSDARNGATAATKAPSLTSHSCRQHSFLSSGDIIHQT